MKVFFNAMFLITLVLLAHLSFSQVSNSEQPTVVSAVVPVYPTTAKAVRVVGDVFVDVEINRKGEVTSVQHVNAHPLLRKVVEEAASRWKFSPALESEKKRRVRLTFAFRIVGEKTSRFDGTPIFHPPYKIEIRDEIGIIQTYSAH